MDNIEKAAKLLLLVALIVVFLFLGIVIYSYLVIDFPVAKAKRDYLISHPEQTVITEWQN